MAKKYLVTGGTGFLGSALVRGLVQTGHQVRTLDNNSRGSADRLSEFANDVEIIDGDIRDPEAVHKAIQGVDAVCHLAYVNGTRFFYEKPALVLEVGVKGMMNVLDGCIKANVGELILASSSEVYQTPPVVPTPENVPLLVPDPHNPRYSYGGGKIISELLALNYGREFFERVLVFRPHNVYGPNMGWEHVIPEFVLRMKKITDESDVNPIPFPIQGNGQETRAFIYIEDFTQGLLRVIEEGSHLNIYHIGTAEEITVMTVAQEVAHYFDRGVKIVPGQLQAGSTLRRCPDITKLSALGFTPHYSFAQGVGLTAHWYVENAHKQPQGAA